MWTEESNNMIYLHLNAKQKGDKVPMEATINNLSKAIQEMYIALNVRPASAFRSVVSLLKEG